MKYQIISDECIGCGSCMSECHRNAIVEKDDKFFIALDLCDGCAKCQDTCPVGAIAQK